MPALPLQAYCRPWNAWERLPLSYFSLLRLWLFRTMSMGRRVALSSLSSLRCCSSATAIDTTVSALSDCCIVIYLSGCNQNLNVVHMPPFW